jgi:tetratricopeptide (TPR) repeat protein
MNQKHGLDATLHARIGELSEHGNALSDAGNYEQALECFERALNLLPPPPEDWEAGLWLMVAIADTHYLSGDSNKALQLFKRAMQCPDALGNAFIHLRLGQCHHDLGDQSKAADELARAYMGDGIEIFEGEPPQYLEFLRTRMRGI